MRFRTSFSLVPIALVALVAGCTSGDDSSSNPGDNGGGDASADSNGGGNDASADTSSSEGSINTDGAGGGSEAGSETGAAGNDGGATTDAQDGAAGADGSSHDGAAGSDGATAADADAGADGNGSSDAANDTASDAADDTATGDGDSASDGASSGAFVTGINAIELVVAGGYLYWTNGYAFGRVSLTAAPGGTGEQFAEHNGQWSIQSFVIGGDTIYFPNQAYQHYAIGALPVTGGTDTAVSTPSDSPVAVTVDGSDAFWTTTGAGYSGTIWTSPTSADGGAGTQLYTMSTYFGAASHALYADASHIIFSNLADNTISQIPRAGLPEGGTPEVLATNVGTDTFFMDADHLYWFAADGTFTSGPRTGTDGGSGTALYQETAGLIRYTVDDQYVYWIAQGGDIKRVSLTADAGAPDLLAHSDDTQLNAIAVDDTYVYWAGTDTMAINRAIKHP
jgi:hypothetical protein